MERPDSLLSNITGWLVAFTAGGKILFDYLRTRSAGRKEDAEAKRMQGEATAEQVKAETDAADSLFARAERQLISQQEEIVQMRSDIKELRAEVRRLTVIEDQALREGLAHDREAEAWKLREADLLAQIDRLRSPHP